MFDSNTYWGFHIYAEGDSLAIKGYIALGWPEMGDLSKIQPTREAFKTKVAEVYGNVSHAANSAGQLFRFLHEMKQGDNVIYRSKVDRQIHVGTIAGPYLYRPDEDFPNVRAVKWLGTYPLTQFSQGALAELGSALTLFQVKNYADEYHAAFAGEATPKATPSDDTVAIVAADIEQTAHDFVFKQLARHLKGYGFQSFVAHLLTTMGYRTVESAKGTDDGIDIIAHKDELKLEPPIIKVQVKSTEGSIGGPDVKQLSGNLGNGEYGLLVTTGTYSRQAKDFAKSRANLRLVDGEELIELILEHYEQLDARYKALLPLKKVYIPEPVTEEAEKWAENKTEKTATARG